MWQIIIAAIWLSLATADGAHAETFNNDYFSPERDEELLRTNERYHLSSEKFFAKFQEAIETNRYDYALNELKFVLRYWPNHPQALMFMGTIAQLIKAPNLAKVYYENALHLYPQHEQTWTQYGAYLLECDQAAEAIKVLKQAVRINPQSPRAWGVLAKAYRTKGELSAAQDAERQAQRLGFKK